MDISTYISKVRGCWFGKNIGGSLGAPLECKRGVFDVDYYTHDISKGVLPNDDLDLQLVWLNAAERYGKQLNAAILGTYWQFFITANWSEYGAGKNNLRMGLTPPLSGWYGNPNRDSCGAFIRSEIWACLMPGHPQMAVKYAYEDSIVDHSGEGVYAAVFCAALQSAAFVESDIRKLIDIALTYIPADCGVARGVGTAIRCYESGEDWKACRKKILQEVPGSFGMLTGYEDREPEPDVPAGPVGYDAPSNIGITVLGLLYGEGDFDKTICLAANCGEDADCTAATAGALFGIIRGEEALPKKWLDPIGEEIKTISVDVTDSQVKIPATISELTDRVVALMPVFLQGKLGFSGEGRASVEMRQPEELKNAPEKLNSYADYRFEQVLHKQPFTVQYHYPSYDVDICTPDGVTVREGAEKRIVVNLENKFRRQQWLDMKWHLPENWEMRQGKHTSVYLDSFHGSIGYGSAEFHIIPQFLEGAKYTAILEITSNTSGDTVCIPVVFLHTNLNETEERE